MKENPIGVGNNPRFSWIMQSDERNQSQTAYQIIISDDTNILVKNIGNIWDSKKTISSQSILTKYSGTKLKPGSEYFWKVKVWDKNGKESAWSTSGKFVTALIDSTDWNGAKWIGYEDIDDSLYLVPGIPTWGRSTKNIALRRAIVPIFRKEFSTEKQVKSAFLFITGLGQYQAWINGNQVSDDFLSPSWTDYRKTCLYNTYDVTQLINKGSNAIGVMVGTGFYNINNERYRKMLITYGMPKMIARLCITFTDGSQQDIVSNNEWKASPSPITYSSLYGGESYDATLEQSGWNKAEFDETKWQNALLAKIPEGKLKPQITYPLRVMEIITADTIYNPAPDTFLFDMGQNASGIVRLRVKGQKGQTIRMFPGELKTKTNYVSQKHTGKPNYFEYTLKGEGIEEWQPSFTYTGYRYIQVTGGIPASLEKNNTKAQIISIELLHTYNSTPRTGSFSCSNELFKRVNKLILYAIQSNMASIMTDCPHREKLGWLEETYLMGGSMHYNFDLYQLYWQTIENMIGAQGSDGFLPEIAPEFIRFPETLMAGIFNESPEWGAALIILPWLIYDWYGDKSAIEYAWPAMEKYMSYLRTKSPDFILSYGLSDWYDLGPKRPGLCQLTPAGLTGTATYFYNAQLMSRMSQLLGNNQQSILYKELSDSIKQAFNQKFFNDSLKIYGSGSQTSMAMPISLNMVPENDYQQVVSNLIDSINKNNKALTAGDIGFHYLVDALTRNGHSQLFYEMNNRDDVPGYGFQLRKGATSLTESWNANEEVSNNHLMLGHIMEWFYKGLGGINQADTSIAYKTIVINPSYVGDISEVNSQFQTPYGNIVSNWKKNKKMSEMTINIPVNTCAIVYLPSPKSEDIEENGKNLKDIESVEIIETKTMSTIIKLGSGSYHFSIKNSSFRN